MNRIDQIWLIEDQICLNHCLNHTKALPLSVIQSVRDSERVCATSASGRTTAQLKLDMHPILIGIVTANTSLTVFYWNFLLSQVFCKKIKDAPEKEEVPVWVSNNITRVTGFRTVRYSFRAKISLCCTVCLWFYQLLWW